MAYDKIIYDEVSTGFSKKHLEAALRTDKRREEIYEKLPEIKRIDDEIAENAANLTKSAINGILETELLEIEKKIKILNDEKQTLMATGGFAIDYLTNVYHCSSCKDKGYIDNKMCQCFKKELVKRAYSRSNMAGLLEEQSFESFDLSYYSEKPDEVTGISPFEQMKSVYNECIAFADNFKNEKSPGLFMYGPTGLGKTFLSSAIAKGVLEKDYTVYYQSAGRIFSLLIENKQSFEPEKRDMVDFIFNCDLLIIDDLGTEMVNSYTAAQFFEVLNLRMINSKKTILNSNLSLMEIENLYSERVSSRLLEFKVLGFCGEDIRFVKFKNKEK